MFRTLAGYLLILLWVALLSGGCGAGARPASTVSLVPTPAPQPLQLTILHTNDTWGYLLPCG